MLHISTPHVPLMFLQAQTTVRASPAMRVILELTAQSWQHANSAFYGGSDCEALLKAFVDMERQILSLATPVNPEFLLTLYQAMHYVRAFFESFTQR
jgi:hypothetical protein